MRDNVPTVAVLHTQGVENDPSFEEWRQLPKISNSTKLTTIRSMVFDILQETGYL
jgi:hypothetical protein